ncbi:MAG: DUF4982 domain-containing protein, partial [Bacteroidales bacterium]|nr:DUF4982 domain-containing protein [Bacteroidales bacterium]
FPHWNWTIGDTVDVWAYSGYDEVELFLNGRSLGAKTKSQDDLHLMWRVPYQPGTIKAVARSGEGMAPLTAIINTAGEASMIRLKADRTLIQAGARDLSFITVEILDAEGNLVPTADNLVNFSIEGNAEIAGVDNGLQTSHEPFKADYRKAFNGKCLVVIEAGKQSGKVVLKAESKGLESDLVEIEIN